MGKRSEKKKTEKFKFSIKLKILIPAALIIIVLASAMGMFFYAQLKNEMIAMGSSQAKMSVLMATADVNGDTLAKIDFSIKPSVSDTIIINDIKNSLKTVMKNCNVRFMYTLYTDDAAAYYGIDASEAQFASPAGELYETALEEMQGALDGEIVVDDFISDTEYGALMTAIGPIKNSRGDVIGLIGADFDASEIMNRLNTIKGQIILIVILGIIAANIILNFIVSAILKNIKLVNDKLFDLVNNEGDLTQKLEVKTGDEMEEMADNMNALLGHIREVMTAVSGGSVELNGSSKLVADNLIKASDNINDVSATMEQMSAAMQETSASLTQINSAIAEAYERIAIISESAIEGSEFAVEISEKAGDIHGKASDEKIKAAKLTQEIARTVGQKIEESKKVEEINVLTDNILNITEETSLLALNASIEAARAGDAGRGFAVVATQISKLAADSATAAEQIQTVSKEVIDAVSGLAAEAQKMIAFIETDAMEGYVKLLNTSADYSDDADDIKEKMEKFAEASRALEAAMNTVKDSLDAVGVAVEESAKGVVTVSETSAELSESMRDIGSQADNNLGISENLNKEIGKFKL